MCQSPEQGMMKSRGCRTRVFWLVAIAAPPPSSDKKHSHEQESQLDHSVGNRAQKLKMGVISRLLYCFETANNRTKFAQGKNTIIYLLLPFGSMLEPDEDEYILLHSIKFY